MEQLDVLDRRIPERRKKRLKTEAAGDQILASSGMVILLIGTVLVFMAETFFISRQEQVYALTAVFVVLIFLGQAAFGGSILLLVRS